MIVSGSLAIRISQRSLLCWIVKIVWWEPPGGASDPDQSYRMAPAFIVV